MNTCSPLPVQIVSLAGPGHCQSVGHWWFSCLNHPMHLCLSHLCLGVPFIWCQRRESIECSEYTLELYLFFGVAHAGSGSSDVGSWVLSWSSWYSLALLLSQPSARLISVARGFTIRVDDLWCYPCCAPHLDHSGMGCRSFDGVTFPAGMAHRSSASEIGYRES